MVPQFKNFAFCCVCFFLVGCEQPQPADLILVNASIYTVDDQNPWAEALAIRAGDIVGVGTNADVLAKFEGPQRDLDGKMVLPGFHDSHSHLIYGGLQMSQCDLSGLGSPAAILAAIEVCDQSLDPSDWLVGGGWDLSLFVDANPSKTLLDQVNPDRRTFLRAADGHSAWVSSAALRYAGIESETPDPADGIIERDSGSQPSGVVRESAMLLVENVLPAIDATVRESAARQAIALAHQNGITSVIDAAATTADAETYEALAASDVLNMRVVLAMSVIAPFFDPAPVESIEPEHRQTQKLVRRQSAKIFVDGVLEGETAALIAPYFSDKGGHGMLITPAEELQSKVIRLDAMGVQLMFHAIGDFGVRVALDAIEAAQTSNGDQDLRHHISHLQLIDPVDRPRFKALNVAANVQALWALPDSYIMDVNLPAVGPDRVQAMYPIGSLDAVETAIVGGSDWPVSSMNPLLAIETALTRQDPTGVIAGVLNEQETVSLATMIAAYTKNGAHLMHQEQLTGQLQVGKRADLVVLSDNLFTLAPHEISEVSVVATYFEGRQVFPYES